MTPELVAHVEGRAATLRILEWVEAFAPFEHDAAGVWELLSGGYSADEHNAAADYAVTRWERLPWTEGTAVMAYLVPVLA